MPIEIANESDVDVDTRRLERLARYVLNDKGVNPLVELSIRLVDVDAMTALHVHFMNEPGPTDVLAFPMDELHDRREDVDVTDAPPALLGDVVLCPSIAAEQAVKARHSAEDELHLLCTHGILHLLGYDHGDAAEEREMFSEQGRILRGWSEKRQQ
ncbi:MAG TPA: rRNA maturation RNase YbeY [Mycobacteriales bacterium]|nr:rRNA maturation RNase YbeY [Mycobacteriales bacterium]